MVSHNTLTRYERCAIRRLRWIAEESWNLGNVDKAIHAYNNSLSHDNGSKVSLDNKPREFVRDNRIRILALNLENIKSICMGRPFAVEIEVS